MGKKTVTSLVSTEQNTLQRVGKELPSGLTRQDRAAKVPAGVAVQARPKPKALKQTITEEYYDKNGQSDLRGSSSKFTKKD